MRHYACHLLQKTQETHTERVKVSHVMPGTPSPRFGTRIRASSSVCRLVVLGQEQLPLFVCFESAELAHPTVRRWIALGAGVCSASCSPLGLRVGLQGEYTAREGRQGAALPVASCGCQAGSASALLPGRGISFNSHRWLVGFDFSSLLDPSSLCRAPAPADQPSSLGIRVSQTWGPSLSSWGVSAS